MESFICTLNHKDLPKPNSITQRQGLKLVHWSSKICLLTNTKAQNFRFKPSPNATKSTCLQ